MQFQTHILRKPRQKTRFYNLPDFVLKLLDISHFKVHPWQTRAHFPRTPTFGSLYCTLTCVLFSRSNPLLSRVRKRDRTRNFGFAARCKRVEQKKKKQSRQVTTFACATYEPNTRRCTFSSPRALRFSFCISNGKFSCP